MIPLALRRGLRAGALLAAALLTACASGPPPTLVDFNPRYDFGSVKRIGSYRESGVVVGENPLRLSDMTRERVDTALERSLAAKGMTIVEDPAQADLLLSWHLVTEEKTDVRTYETPAYGSMYAPGFYPYNRYSMYNCWSCMPTRTDVSVQQYTEGTFVVDLIDPALGKSVWRSVTVSRLKGDLGRDQDRYDAAAARIMAEFPPGSAAAARDS